MSNPKLMRQQPRLRSLESRLTPALNVTQVTIPTAGSMPREIVSFGDTSYFTSPGANKIVNANKNGTFINELTVPTANSEPFGISQAPTATGVWFTERAANKIGFLTSLNVFTEYPIPTAASEPYDIAAGPDGNMWFTERTANKIARANLTGDVVTSIDEFPLPNAMRLPAGICAGPDGNMWFTQHAGRIGRITPAGVITEFIVNGINTKPEQIVAGPDGNLWVTESTANRVIRFTTDGGQIDYNLTTPNAQPMAISAGPNDIWFTESAGNKIGRINLRIGILIEYPLPTAASGPQGISADMQNNIWFTESAANKYASFIVPPQIVTGADAGGGPHVRVFDSASNALLYGFFAYDGNFTGGVRVAVGDVNGDLIPDILTGAGPGGGPHVKLYDGKTGEVLREFFAFDANFHGGVYVALGDRISTKSPTGSFWETVVGAGPGGGPDVRVFKSLTGEMLSDFFAYDASFRGGVRVAAGTGIGLDPIIATGAGPGGGPHVKVVDIFGNAIHSFFAYDAKFTGGVYVGLTYDQNSNPTLITGAGEGGGSHVKIYNGATAQLQRQFFAYDPTFLGGVRVSATPTFGGTLPFVTGAGPTGGPDVRAFDLETLERENDFFAYDPRFMGGVFVAIA